MDLKSILETLIFISGRPLGTSDMLEALKGVPDGPQPTKKELEEALDGLGADWEARGGGVALCRVAEGYEFRSVPAYARWIKQLNKPKPQRLSIPAVETMALIAYRQPLTRSDIESIRGVDSGGVLKSLSDRRLVKVVGRKEEPGRPLLYATTGEFLEFFGLKDLADLPPLREFEEMIRQQASEGDSASGSAELSVTDLISSAEELEAVDETDREALGHLEETLKSLKDVEKAAVEIISPSAPDASAASSPPEGDSSPPSP